MKKRLASILLATVISTSFLSTNLMAKELAIVSNSNTINNEIKVSAISNPKYTYDSIDLYQNDSLIGNYTNLNNTPIKIDTTSKISKLKAVINNPIIVNKGSEIYIKTNMPYYNVEGTPIEWNYLFNGLGEATSIKWKVKSYNTNNSLVSETEYDTLPPSTLLAGTHIVSIDYYDLCNEKFSGNKIIKVAPKTVYTAKITIPNLAITTDDTINWTYSFNGIANEVRWYINDEIQDTLPNKLEEGTHKIKLEIINELGEVYSDEVEMIVINIPISTTAKKIESGNQHTAILAEDGRLYVCGGNDYGQLGLGDKLSRNTPTLITELGTNVADISCGNYDTLVLMKDGTLKCFGQNAYGQLGLGDKIDRISPTNIESITDRTEKIYSSNYYHMAILTDGRVMVWGENSLGQLGLGDTNNRLIPVENTYLYGNVESISSGYGHSLALMKNGTVFGWGLNSSGQLGFVDTTSRLTPTKLSYITSTVLKVCAFGSSSFILYTNGGLYTFGYGYYGELGLGDKNSKLIPTAVSYSGQLFRNAFGQGNYCIAMLGNGYIMSWGFNNCGQLGLGDKVNRLSPTRISDISQNISEVYKSTESTFIKLQDGSIVCFGNNSRGQLGLGDTTNRYTPTEFKIK